MLKTNKYNANSLYYCQQTGKIFQERQDNSNFFFASIFEYRVYQALIEITHPNLISLQVPILIKHASKNYPAIFWKCDFRIYKNHYDKNEYINIEAKGVATKEFKRILKYMDWFSSINHQRLLVVGEGKPVSIDSCVKTCSVTSMTKALKAMGYGTIYQ